MLKNGRALPAIRAGKEFRFGLTAELRDVTAGFQQCLLHDVGLGKFSLQACMNLHSREQFKPRFVADQQLIQASRVSAANKVQEFAK